jgi:hypothetical protein
VHRIAKSIRNIDADKQKDTKITGASGIKPLKYCCGTIKSIHKIYDKQETRSSKVSKDRVHSNYKVCLG